MLTFTLLYLVNNSPVLNTTYGRNLSNGRIVNFPVSSHKGHPIQSYLKSQILVTLSTWNIS